jgi:hypothetical protein
MSKIAIYTLFLAVLLASCKPEGAKYYDETDIIFTNYDDEFKFSDRKTYAMPDSIVAITGEAIEGNDPEFMKEPMNTDIINQIAANMNSLGWERIEDPEQADVVLFPAAWKSTTVYYWYNYWCWWYPYYCGWGYYPTYAGSYTTGTVVMSMIIDGDEYAEPHNVWSSALNGLLSGSYNSSRVKQNIDQAFIQSPYLNVN